MRALLAGLGLVLVLAPLAFAEEEAEPARRVVIVLDRGAAARDSRRTDANNALRLWTALTGRGVDCAFLAAGVDEDGTTLVDDVTPTRQGLEALGRRPVFDFQGPTDPRAALARALEHGGEGAVDVVLLGPFEPGAEPDEPKADYADAVERWNEDAAAGSRILAVRTHADGRARLADARGLVGEGRLVVGFGAPQVETQPFSPFAAPEGGIEARVLVMADVLGLGQQTRHGAVLTARSDVAADDVRVDVTAGLHTIVVRRQPRDGRTATLAFQLVEDADDVHWLADAPDPLTFRWDELAKEARLVGRDDAPAAAFAAVDVTVGSPKEVTLRLLRTRTGPTPAWRVRAEEGELPPGLSVTIGDEVQVSPEVGEAPVRLVFEARAGRPLEAQGTLRIEADGVDEPVRLPYEIRVAKGEVRLEGTVVPASLPPSAAEPRTTIRLVAENDNAPAALQLRARCDGGQERWLRGLVGTAGGDVTRWDLQQPLLLDVGVERTLAFELDESAPPELVWPCEVTLVPEKVTGVEVDGRVVLTVRKRKPRIELVGPPPTFRLEDGTLRADTPFVLRLDPDGGDGDYLLELLQTSPSLRSRGGLIGWQAVTRGQGVWHIVPTGEWAGAEPGIFQDQDAHVDLEIVWPVGRTPGTVSVPVEVKARWGKRGFVILSLALMALLLALLVVGYMRTPPVQGVLLYTVDGLDGTVGRLDLAAVGRKPKRVLTDDKGKLSIGTKGDAIAKVRPTRVGGMLEYIDHSGVKERRLLVDGVSLRIGRHLVRYIYGRPEDEVQPTAGAADEDLLGPEYDLESGKIDALENE